MNYGWPCHEGPQTNTYYTSVTMDLCSSLGTVTDPLYDYAQTGHMATSDGCPPLDGATRAGASISGLAFATSASYPAPYRNGLFVADYSRNCIIVLPDAGSGVPSGTAIPFEHDAVTPVNLTTDPNGNIVYGDFGTGTVHRIRYAAPTASFTATPSNGTAPLTVNFDASASKRSIPPRSPATTGTSATDPATAAGSTTSHLYAAGTYTARLTVTDSNNMTATTTKQISSGNTPPSVTIDQPTCTTNCWKVGDTITLQAHATDAQDGALADSRFTWHVGLQHCHSADDCHEHDLLDPTGVSTTTFVAPDHDAGSFLRITVTVTDSGGLTDSKTIDVYPKSTTMTVQSSPAGLPVALDGVSGTGSVGPQPMLVGHAASVQAQSTAAIGETMYAFSSWSDGGALTHTVNAPATATTLTATYHLISDDAPDTCAAAPVQSVGSTPVSAKFGKANDVDWIKFSVSSTRWYRFVVGDLPVDAVMTLYKGCSTALVSSNAAGTHWEELLRSLSPGTYALRIASVGGAQSATPYRWQVQALSGTTPLLMAKSISTTSIRYVGDVFNTSTSPRSITIKATMYSASGKVLEDRDRPPAGDDRRRTGPLAVRGQHDEARRALLRPDHGDEHVRLDGDAAALGGRDRLGADGVDVEDRRDDHEQLVDDGPQRGLHRRDLRHVRDDDQRDGEPRLGVDPGAGREGDLQRHVRRADGLTERDDAPGPRDLGGRPARGAAQRLHRRQLLVVLVADRVEVGGLDVQLPGDLVGDRGLLGVDRPVGRLDREAAAEELLALLRRRDLAELAGHDVVLGPALGSGLDLRHLDHEDRLRLVEPAVLEHELLHDRGLLGADVEVGVRGAAHHVGEAREEARLLVRHRLEAGDDLADRGGLGVGPGRGQRAGGGRRGRPPCGDCGSGPRNRWKTPMNASYQRSWAGWPGLTATKVPRPVAVTMPADEISTSTVARSSPDSATRARSVTGRSDGVGCRRRIANSRVTVVGGLSRPRTRIRCHAAVQFAWQSRSVPRMPPLTTPSNASWSRSGRHSATTRSGSSGSGWLATWSPCGFAGPQPKQRPAGA